MLHNLNAQNGKWETDKTPMPIKKYSHCSAVVDGKIYIIGGQILTGEDVNETIQVVGSIEVYDPLTDTWDTTRTNMPTPRSHSACVAIDKKIYVIGGTNWEDSFDEGNILEVYDTETDTWDTNKALMPTIRIGCRAVVFENKIFVAGAWDSSRNIAVSFEVYDPLTDHWEILPDLIEPAGAMSMDTLNRKIYITGGTRLSYENAQKTIQIYDLDTDSWQISDTKLPNASWTHGSCIIDKTIYLIGGMESGQGDYFGSTCPIVMFDTENNILFNMSDIPTPRAAPSIHVIENMVYVIGGMEAEMNGRHYLNGIHNEVEVYTPQINPIYAKEVFINQKFVDPVIDNLIVQTDFANKYNTDIIAYAHIKSTDNSVNDSILLYDDGLHADGDAQDGIYGTNITIESENNFVLGISSINSDNGAYFIRDEINRFTSIGPVIFDGFSFTSADTIPNPGDRISFKPILKNLGEITPASNIRAVITSLDTLGSISDRPISFDDISPGGSIIGNNSKSLTISDICPDNTELKLKIDIASNLFFYWTDTITILVRSETSGIDEYEVTSKISIYPNPTNGVVNLVGLTFPSEVKIYSTQGLHIKTKKQVTNSIEISELPAGIYFLNITQGNKTIVKKTVIKK